MLQRGTNQNFWFFHAPSALKGVPDAVLHILHHDRIALNSLVSFRTWNFVQVFQAKKKSVGDRQFRRILNLHLVTQFFLIDGLIDFSIILVWASLVGLAKG